MEQEPNDFVQEVLKDIPAEERGHFAEMIIENVNTPQNSNQLSPAEGKAKIESWTRDTIYNSNEPFELLYQFRDQGLIFEQLFTYAKQVAKKCGISATDFNKMWNAYIKSKYSDAMVVGEYATVFPDQPMKLNSGKYVCDEYGITYTGRYGEEIKVCPHAIMPVGRLIDIENEEQSLLLAFQRGKDKWKTLPFPRQTLASAQKIISLAGCGISVHSENAKELVKYLATLESLNYDTLPTQTSTNHLGWLPDGQFAPYCKNVVFSGESAEHKRIYNAFTPTGNEEKWMELAKAVRAGDSVPARMALAASFAAPLVSICNALPFFVHLWGDTGCGKTVALMLAASVWANPSVYIKSFSGTKVSQELYAAFCCNAPVLLDELQVISDRKMFDDIIYMLCEGMSKSRGAKDGGLQVQHRWSTCIITTGEMPIVQSNSGGGAAVRTIEVNFGGKPLFEDASQVADTVKENYGFAGQAFIEQLKRPEIVSAIKVKLKQYQSKLSGNIQDKQVLSASILLAADRLASETIFHDKHYLTVDEIKPYLVTRKDSDLNRRLYDTVCGWVLQNEELFRAKGNEHPAPYYGVKVSDTEYHILNTALETELKQIGGNMRSFREWAERNKAIEKDCQHRDRENPKWHTALKLDAFKDEEKNENDIKFMVVDKPDDMPF